MSDAADRHVPSSMCQRIDFEHLRGRAPHVMPDTIHDQAAETTTYRLMIRHGPPPT